MKLKILKNKRVMSVRNTQGIKVKRCCASCKYKCYDDNGKRFCSIMQLPVEQKSLCTRWVMANELQKMGHNPGKVKSREYLRFVQKVRSEEMVAIEEGRMTKRQCLTVEQLREEFRKAGGSVYAIH